MVCLRARCGWPGSPCRVGALRKRVCGLTPGDYYLSIEAKDHANFAAPIKLEAGKETVLKTEKLRTTDLGFGFRRVVLAEPSQASFESIGHFEYLYFGDRRLCQVDACSVSPSTAQMPRCTISPGSINPGATATLTVTTTAPISAAAATTSNIRLLYAILLPMMGLAFTIGLRSQTRYQKLSTALLRCMTCVVLICQPACGGGSSGGANTGTPPGSYTITVTGMSGSSLKHSATLMLKIQ